MKPATILAAALLGIAALLAPAKAWGALTSDDLHLRGTWYDPATSGQGLLVDIIDLGATPSGEAAGKVLFAGWYTYAATGSGKLWLTLQGALAEGSATQQLSVALNEGGRFNAPPVTSSRQVGTATLTTNADGSLDISVDFTASDARFHDTDMRLTKLAVDQVGVTLDGRDLRGSWYDPLTSGQGVQVDTIGLEGGRVFFGALYTYRDDGRQVWFTLGGSTHAGAAPELGIYENSGGAFNAPPVTASKQVGTARAYLDQDTHQLVINYALTGASAVGVRTGSMRLSKVRPAVDWSNVVDTSKRADVLAAYDALRVLSQDFNPQWTGSAAACDAGDMSPAARQRWTDGLNIMRGLAGLPSVSVEWDPTILAEQQQGALLVVTHGSPTHHPPTDTPCYTVIGEKALERSSVGMGRPGVSAVAGAIADDGPTNARVGHRMMMLSPAAGSIAVGETYGPMGSTTNGTTVAAVSAFRYNWDQSQPLAWPAAGFFPAEFASRFQRRWSFSLAEADYTNATVSMRRLDNGATVPLFIDHQDADGPQTLNTIVWVPSIPDSAITVTQDLALEVRVEGVKVGAEVKAFTYQVTLVRGLR